MKMILEISNGSGSLGGSPFYHKKKEDPASRPDFEPFFHDACDRARSNGHAEKDLSKVLDALLRL